nr:YezD family protein [Oceanobacillus alkalisoli]
MERGDYVANVNDKKIADIVTELKKLKYGNLIITVHDDEITQIETTEKKRYQPQGKKQRTS